MQNKPNFQDAQMNVTTLLIMDYENKCNWTLGENKPNSKPIKPNLPNAQMSVKSILTKDYERNDIFAVPENKAKTNPIQTQSNPICRMSGRSSWRAHSLHDKSKVRGYNPSRCVTTKEKTTTRSIK